jgi:hypothetical protein
MARPTRSKPKATRVVSRVEDWRDGYRRMHRSFAKLAGHQPNSAAYDDDLYHFFQDAWHLKDWIKNDPDVPQTVKDRIENDLESILAFRIGADLANGSKHVVLTQNVRTGAQIFWREQRIHVGGATTQFRIVRLDNGDHYDAAGVADEIIKEWDKLLAQYGLNTQ